MKLVKLLVGFSLSALCLWLVFRGFAFGQLVTALAQASWIWFLPAIGTFLLSHLFRAVRWKTLLSPLKQVSLWIVLPINLMGFLVNCLLPARAGEFARAMAMTKETEIPASSALGSIAAERLTDFLGLFSVMLIALRLMPKGALPIKMIALIIVAGMIAVVGILILLRRYKPHPERDRTWWGKVLLFGYRITLGFAALRSVSKVATIVSAALLVWQAEVLSILFVSRVLHLDLSYLQSATILVGTSVGYMIPAAPGGVGTMEYFARQALLFIGVENTAAVTFVLILHFYQLATLLVFGLPCLLRIGMGQPPSPVPAQ